MSPLGNVIDVTAYPRIQDALDALPPHGGTLYVPAGRHEVHEPVALALDEGLYGIDPEKGRPRIGNRLLDGPGLHHFDEHRPQLESWLASRR